MARNFYFDNWVVKGTLLLMFNCFDKSGIHVFNTIAFTLILLLQCGQEPSRKAPCAGSATLPLGVARSHSARQPS